MSMLAKIGSSLDGLLGGLTPNGIKNLLARSKALSALGGAYLFAFELDGLTPRQRAVYAGALLGGYIATQGAVEVAAAFRSGKVPGGGTAPEVKP